MIQKQVQLSWKTFMVFIDAVEV